MRCVPKRVINRSAPKGRGEPHRAEPGKEHTMKENTAKQIESMQNQTFGVEIECYGISREKAAEAVAAFFKTKATVRHEGGSYDTWSCKDKQGRDWKFQRDSSIIAGYDSACEMVTPVLRWEDMEDLQEVVRQMRHAGAKSDPSHMCGLHIHIGADLGKEGGHTAQSLRNLANLMASHESLLISSIGIDENRINTYCHTVDPNFLEELNKKKPTSMDALEDIWYKTQGADFNREWHYNKSRYHMLNYHATFTKGTIEFRCFQFADATEERKGGLHAGELKSFIQLCLGMSQQAKDLRTASPKEPQRENPKYAMRTWLLRMGFIGETFSTAREILTRNLDGDGAFRHGRTAA